MMHFHLRPLMLLYPQKNPPLTPNPPLMKYKLQKTYFFDLPLSDIYGVGCAALSLIYFGTRRGAFGNREKGTISLDDTMAFRMVLKHRTVERLSNDYSYSLVYYRAEIAEIFWSRSRRYWSRKMKKMMRHVNLQEERSIKPNRIRKLSIPSNRPVHVARIEHLFPADDYVPVSYIKEFSQRYLGFLIRYPKGFPIDDVLFNPLGLFLIERRCALASRVHNQCVMAYS